MRIMIRSLDGYRVHLEQRTADDLKEITRALTDTLPRLLSVRGDDGRFISLMKANIIAIEGVPADDSEES